MIAYRPYPQVNAPRANEIVIMESTHGNVSSATMRSNSGSLRPSIAIFLTRDREGVVDTSLVPFARCRAVKVGTGGPGHPGSTGTSRRPQHQAPEPA